MAMTEAPFLDQPPFTDRLNAYDEQHLTIYLQLLMAEEEGADWREVAQVVFGLDSHAEFERAKLVYNNHLARAKWMIDTGYRYLLEPRMQ
jgi:hypothetical protein